MRGLGPFLKDAWMLAKPYFRSEEKWSAWLLLGTVIALSLALVGMNVVLNFWNRAFFNALQDKDWESFISLLFWYKRTETSIMPGFTGIVIVYIVVAVYRSYLTQWLQIRWRRWMTTRFLDEWLADRAFYRISVTSGMDGDAPLGTENPDQRIAEDLRDFIGDSIVGTRGVLSLGLGVLTNVVTLFSFMGILWSLSGSVTILGVTIAGYMVWVALGYSIVGTWLTHLVGRPLAILNFRKQRVEADFRFALVRLRENTEGVALYGGETEEKRGLRMRFTAVVANWLDLMKRTKALNTLTFGYDQIAGIFPLVVAAPRYFAGSITLGGLTQTAGAFGEVQGALSWVVSTYSDIAVWRATVERLATFHRAIVAARAAHGQGIVATKSAEQDYVLSDLTLRLPDGTVLLDRANLSFRPHEGAVISGRSGSGKSTLFRALAGIWPFGSGTIQKPPGRSLFLPQRPYLPLGTLRHVIAYPESETSFSDTDFRDALSYAGLDHLIPRLDSDERWAQVLSGGEQQRVAMARALLLQPDWLFLDEATANLDPEAENFLHDAMRTRLPNTTIVAISHRPLTDGGHDRRLVFDSAHKTLLENSAIPAPAK
jgi:putative ATP-binding cassette transporter